MLGYFADPKVAFVQGPQEFYNRDSFQHLHDDPDAWHEQAMFFRAIQVGKNRWNSAFWCGCPSILRRSALESVGGIRDDTVTEDLHTSLKLHALGWRSIYHPGIVALGIAPNDYHGFILQRLRWAAGTMQVIRREWRIRGLTMAQRISYLSSIGTYFDALRKATFLAIVPLVFLTDQLPLATSLLVFLTFWTIQFLLNGYANNLLARGNNRYLMTEFFDLMKMFAFIHATVTLITGRQVRFQVTPKGGSADRRLQGLLAPYVALILVYALSVVVGLARVTGLLPTYILAAQVAAMLWAFGILCVLIAVVVYGYRKVSQRSADRVRVNLEARYREAYQRIEQPATIENLTTSGCAIRTAEAPSIARSMAVRILEPPLAFRARVRTVRTQPDGFVSGLSIQASPSTAVELALILADSILSQAPGRGAEAGEPPEVESIAA